MMQKLDTNIDDEVTYVEWVEYMRGVKAERGELSPFQRNFNAIFTPIHAILTLILAI